MRARALLLGGAMLLAALPLASGGAATCPLVSVADSAPADAPLRVFAMQFKQHVDYVTTYESFAQKMDCLVRQYVLPNCGEVAGECANGRVNLVVFNEDIGLATLATGTRGAPARAIAASPARGNGAFAADNGAPFGAALGLGSVAAGYAGQIAAYRSLFREEDPRRAVITAATDTFVRGFMKTFSELARTYNIYVVASNNQANFRESFAPSDIAAFADPDLRGKYDSGELKSVYVATSADAWNQAFLWAPSYPDWSGQENQKDWLTQQIDADVAMLSPDDPRKNLLAVNKKIPLTQIEKDFLALSDGTMKEANTGPFVIPALGNAYRFGFAISFPAFKYGDANASNKCADGELWMRCLHHRGVNVVLQPEANPGPWARYGADGGRWQALTWGASTLRAVTDPTVPNFKYLVCPHMVGNLLDLGFDGQSAIMMRGRTGPGRHYVGARVPVGNDDGYAIYSGDRPEFLALAPWVTNELPFDPQNPQAWNTDNRAYLQERANGLLAGSGSEYENAYLETAIWADLPVPA